MPRAPHPDYPPSLGARYLGDGRCQFRVWAPRVQRMDLKLLDPEPRVLAMRPDRLGYYELLVEGIAPSTRYWYLLEGKAERPDPASRFQPEGVNQPSAVVDPTFDWTDASWSGIPLREYITYEMHVGTFSEAGTFDGAIAHLDELAEIGFTALEIMPVAQFPGHRNWGYDGVHPFAPQNTYGGPEGLKRLVDACHRRGLAVVLDVVYNHIGPEGNYLGEFGHYFTPRYQTPWGQAINFDDRDSDEVRRYFIENALYWIDEFHVDSLRLDAVHAIYDFSARPILRELADAVRLEGQRLGRQVFSVAESSLNDPRLVEPKQQGGCGLDGQWNDDLHHALRTTLTGDNTGYFQDFHGFDDLVKAFRVGFVEDGCYSVYRGRRHGAPAGHISPERMVVCSQNHDQVGNRMLGERLTEFLSFEQLKLAAGTVLLSPYQPMIFMGEEYAETARFQYFISHQDPGLIEAVRRGRKEEFRAFRWQGGEPPDPQAEETFARCKLNHALRGEGHHRVMREFYRALIALRKSEAPLAFADRARMETISLRPNQVMASRRWSSDREICVVLNYGEEPANVSLPLPAGTWKKLLDSSDPRWQGRGASLPETLESHGSCACRVAAHSLAVIAK